MSSPTSGASPNVSSPSTASTSEATELLSEQSHQPQDDFLKQVMGRLFATFVEAKTQVPIHPPAQFADVFVASAAAHPKKMVQALGVLGRMACQPCLIEAFSAAVSLSQAEDCLRKLLNARHMFKLDTQSPIQGATEPMPMWLLSAGRPETVLQRWKMKHKRGWPKGYDTGSQVHGLWLVVLTELPKTIETTTLRLFGTPKLQDEVLAEVKELNPQHPTRQVVVGVLQAWYAWLNRGEQEQRSKAQMDLALIQQLIDEDKKRLWDEAEAKGRKEGKKEGLQVAVAAFYEAFGIKFGDEQRQQVEKLSGEKLQVLLDTLCKTRAWPT